MSHQFMYPKVTPVRPGGGLGGAKPSGSGATGGVRRTA
jgi:hypothetical protein